MATLESGEEGDAGGLVLEEVPPADFRQLVEAIKHFRPDSYQIESILLLDMQYHHLSIMGAKVYTPRSALYRYKMVVLTPTGTTTEMDSMGLFWSPAHLSDDDVCRLLRSLPAVTWTRPFMIRQIPRHLQRNMNAIMRELSSGSLQLKFTIPQLLFVMKDKIPPVPRLPDGCYAKKICPQYSEQILSRWAGRITENIGQYTGILERLPSVGIFKRSGSVVDQEWTTAGQNLSHDDTGETDRIPTNRTEPPGSGSAVECGVKEDALTQALPSDGISASVMADSEELVAYCLLKHSADCGMTYTAESHRRLGLATAATLQLVHQIWAENINAFVSIEDKNSVSIAMHNKMGFEYYSSRVVLFYAPDHNFD